MKRLSNIIAPKDYNSISPTDLIKALTAIVGFIDYKPLNKRAVIKPPKRHKNRKHYSTYHPIQPTWREKHYYPEQVDLLDGSTIELYHPVTIKPLVVNDCELSIVPDMYKNGVECYKIQSISGATGIDLELPRFKERKAAIDYCLNILHITPQLYC